MSSYFNEHFTTHRSAGRHGYCVHRIDPLSWGLRQGSDSSWCCKDYCANLLCCLIQNFQLNSYPATSNCQLDDFLGSPGYSFDSSHFYVEVYFDVLDCVRSKNFCFYRYSVSPGRLGDGEISFANIYPKGRHSLSVYPCAHACLAHWNHPNEKQRPMTSIFYTLKYIKLM